MRSPQVWLMRIGCLIAGILIGAAGMRLVSGIRSAEQIFTPSEESELSASLSQKSGDSIPPLPEQAREELAYPPGFLIITEARQDYQDGELELYIPRLNLRGSLLDGAGEEELAQGIGLFDEAQLPEGPEVNSNTSIAAHRDVYGMEFYYVHTMEMGDPIYLKWKGDLYTFEVTDQFVTHDSDWSAVQVQEFPCVTLMSCEPINVSSHRIFTVGKLVGKTPGGDFPE